MKLTHALAVLVLSVAVQAQTFTTVTATNIQNAFGQKLASGQVCFQAVNNNGLPISFRAGNNGQVMNRPVCAAVINGAFSVSLPDTSLTTPANVCYRVTVKDSSTNQIVLGNALPGQPSGYDCLQPSGASFNFDTYTPNLGALVALVAPQGSPGPAGPAGPPGPTGTVSAAGDGSYAAPAISFASDTALGLYKAAIGQMGLAGSVTAPGIADPGTITVTPQGITGSTAWRYTVVAKGIEGTASGLDTKTTAGNSILTTSNYNRIGLPSVPTNALCFDIYRTQANGTPNTTGKIASCVTGSAFNDTGMVADGTTPPKVNTTGRISARSLNITGAECDTAGGAISNAWPSCEENTIQQSEGSAYALAIRPPSVGWGGVSAQNGLVFFGWDTFDSPSVSIGTGINTNAWINASADMPDWNDPKGVGRDAFHPSSYPSGWDSAQPGLQGVIGCVLADVDGPCHNIRIFDTEFPHSGLLNLMTNSKGIIHWVDRAANYLWGPGPNYANSDTSLGRSSAGVLGASGMTTPSLKIGGLATPTNAAHTAAHNAGHLLHSTTYFYRVAALSPCGSTLASAETSIATGTGADDYVVTVNWTPVSAASGYRIYGRTSGTEQLLATIGPGAATTWKDTGTVTPSGALPSSDTSLCGISAPLTTPASSSAACVAGQVAWDASYVYVCTATNAWKRAALTTF